MASMPHPRQSFGTTSDWLILLGLTVTAAVTRIYGLSQWDFVGDEWYTVYEAEARLRAYLNPAYYNLTYASFQLFGVSEWSARLPAALLGIIAVPVFYYTWGSVLGRNAALIGALLIILSSWHLWYSQFSRFYTGVFLFGSLAYYLYLKAFTSDSLKLLLVALLSNALAFLFHATAMVIGASVGAFAFLVLLFGRRMGGPYSRRVATILAVFCTVGGVLALYLYWGRAAEWVVDEQAWGYGPFAVILQVAKYVQVPVAVSALAGVLIMARRDAMTAAFFVVGAGVPLALLVMMAGVASARPDYIFYSIPLAYAAAAYACEQARQALASHRLGAHALTAVVLLSMMPETASHYVGRASHDSRKAIAYVESAYRPGDRIYSHPPFNHYASKTYALETRAGVPYDNSVDWKAALDPYAQGPQRTWVVLPIRRQALASGLELWLRSNARLVWRSYSTRFDYTFEGYQIFLVEGTAKHDEG